MEKPPERQASNNNYTIREYDRTKCHKPAHR
jgi:hypothetical protein